MSDFLYGIVGTVGVLGLITTATLFGASSSGQGATLRDRIMSSPSLSPLLIIHYFLPYGLVILALFMDIMSQLPQGSMGILIAIVVVFINSYFKNTGYVSDLCEIPGWKAWSSALMPQSLLFVSIVVTYLATFATVSSNMTMNASGSTVSNVYTTSKSGTVTTPELLTSSGINSTSPSSSSRIGASWGLAVSVILIQLIGIMSTPECITTSMQVSGFELPPWIRPILSVVLGMSVGGGFGYLFANQSWTQPSYSIANQQAQQVIISGSGTVSSKGPGFVRERFQLGAGLGETPQQGGAPIDIAKTSGAVTPGESSDQFVCEAYKNGQLVSSTLTE